MPTNPKNPKTQKKIKNLTHHHHGQVFLVDMPDSPSPQPVAAN
jgi:hypothetical protein